MEAMAQLTRRGKRPPGKGSALEIIELDSPDTLDIFVGFELFRVGLRIEWCFAQIFRRSQAAFHLDHANDSQPRHAHGLEDHERRGDDVGSEERILQAKRDHGLPHTVLRCAVKILTELGAKLYHGQRPRGPS